MSTWSKNELLKVATTDDLHISPFRDDGKTYGTPTWIWSVVVNDALYIRAYNGQKSRWYQAALRQKTARITAAGSTIDVAFEPVEGAINDRIDDVYRVIVKLWPGKSEEQKRQLAHAIARDVMGILHYGEESVSVAMEEVSPRDWAEKVYEANIRAKPEQIYKEPGYNLSDL